MAVFGEKCSLHHSQHGSLSNPVNFSVSTFLSVEATQITVLKQCFPLFSSSLGS